MILNSLILDPREKKEKKNWRQLCKFKEGLHIKKYCVNVKFSKCDNYMWLCKDIYLFLEDIF